MRIHTKELAQRRFTKRAENRLSIFHTTTGIVFDTRGCEFREIREVREIKEIP
jgi:hypothetical protein